jgi:acyl carrier protein
MIRSDIIGVVLQVLADIAPEAANATIDDAEPLREQLDLDSMDFLNFVIGLHRALHVDIPELDYPKIQSMKDLTSYLEAKLDAA